MFLTSASLITPLPFTTVQTCAGLTGWVRTRKSYSLPRKNLGDANLKGPLARIVSGVVDAPEPLRERGRHRRAPADVPPTVKLGLGAKSSGAYGHVVLGARCRVAELVSNYS